MTTTGVPAPVMRAPQAFKKAARSSTSGSQAAPRSTVVPWAQAAAISSVSVAPTLGSRSVKSAPCSRPARRNTTASAANSICAPMAARPSRWISTGRGPSRQPPGMGMRTCPTRTSSGAK